MNIYLVIKGTLPGLNEYTDKSRSKNWYQSAKMKKDAQHMCEKAIAEQIKGKHLECCHVSIVWFEKNHRRDPDNIMFAKKFIFDALVEKGVLDNDGQAQILSITERIEVDKDNPRIEVVLSEQPCGFLPNVRSEHKKSYKRQARGYALYKSWRVRNEQGLYLRPYRTKSHKKHYASRNSLCFTWSKGSR